MARGDSDKALVKALNQVKHFGNEGRYAKASRGLAQAVSGRRGALEPTEEVVAQLNSSTRRLRTHPTNHQISHLNICPSTATN